MAEKLEAKLDEIGINQMVNFDTFW